MPSVHANADAHAMIKVIAHSDTVVGLLKFFGAILKRWSPTHGDQVLGQGSACGRGFAMSNT